MLRAFHAAGASFMHLQFAAAPNVVVAGPVLAMLSRIPSGMCMARWFAALKTFAIFFAIGLIASCIYGMAKSGPHVVQNAYSTMDGVKVRSPPSLVPAKTPRKGRQDIKHPLQERISYGRARSAHQFNCQQGVQGPCTNF